MPDFIRRNLVDPVEQDQLVRLLDDLADGGGALPSMPQAVFEVIGRVVPLVAVEIGLTRLTRTGGREALLTWRDDRMWHGWHLPGGFVGTGESIARACDRIARQELGIGVRLQALIDTYCWPDHPLGSVLSLICHCESEGHPQSGQWYGAPPSPMVPCHDAMFTRLLESVAP